LTTRLTETQVAEACKTLFGSDIIVRRSFLLYIQPSGAKSAYRRKAKETHPDLFAGADPLQQKKQAMLFIEILKAYDVLNAFFEQRDKGLWKEVKKAAAPRPRERRATPRQPKAAHKDPPKPSERTAQFWEGGIPFRPLEIGRYLYYSKRISYQALIDALVWQRSQRPIIGDLALRWGWLTAGAIDRIIQSTGLHGRFGEKAMGLGLLTSFQIKTLLFFQRSQQERLGEYFIVHKLLAREDLDRFVAEMLEHNASVVARFMKTGEPEQTATA
jgi:curved DNA-binding protein CbpA